MSILKIVNGIRVVVLPFGVVALVGLILAVCLWAMGCDRARRLWSRS